MGQHISCAGNTMRTLRLLAAILCTAVGLRGAEGTRPMVFTITGGQSVQCLVTDSGPLPAEHGPYRVEVAGIGLSQDAHGGTLSLIFTFGLRVAGPNAPGHIVVEDVSGDRAVTLVDDRNPDVEKGYWRRNAAPLPLSRQSAPWMFDGKPTFKVYRITISGKDSLPVVLFQPAWYPRQWKAVVVRSIK